MPKLQINLPDGSTIDHELTDEVVTIGRVSDNTIQIEDPSVSSHHAVLTVADGGDYTLQDLGSTNGTRLNGKGIIEGDHHKLQNADKLRFGSVEGFYGSENASTEREEMPEAVENTQKPAAKSVKPSNFQNASPFQKKSKKKNPVELAVWAIAAIALIALLVSTAMALGISAS